MAAGEVVLHVNRAWVWDVVRRRHREKPGGSTDGSRLTTRAVWQAPWVTVFRSSPSLRLGAVLYRYWNGRNRSSTWHSLPVWLDAFSHVTDSGLPSRSTPSTPGQSSDILHLRWA